MQFFLPTLLLEFSRFLDDVKQQVVDKSTLHGYRQHREVSNQNKIYYALEYLEAKLLSTFYVELTARHKVSSCVWLHDGIWISPPAETELILDCMKETCRRYQLSPLPVHIASLVDELTLKASEGQTLAHLHCKSSTNTLKTTTNNIKALTLQKRQGTIREPFRILKYLTKKMDPLTINFSYVPPFMSFCSPRFTLIRWLS